MPEKQEKKMTLEEYQKKYSKPENVKAAKAFLFIFAAAIGIIVFACLFFVVKQLWEMNEYAGYAGIAIAVLVYIFIYIIPLIKIGRTKPFITNVNARTAKEAKRYNRSLRNDIADKMIDVTAKTEGVGFYSDANIGKLAIARQTNDDKEIKKVLTEIYDTDVRKSANRMIRDHAFKVGITTALSQSDKVDTLFVCAYDLGLIKDIVFLYGFRPSDAKLAKIYTTVIADALIAYGLGSATSSLATSAVTKFGGKAVSAVPLLGTALSTVIDSAAQGVINATLTVFIGIQTKKYLNKEYHLQDILDEIDLSDEKEEESEAELISDVKDNMSTEIKNKKAMA